MIKVNVFDTENKDTVQLRYSCLPDEILKVFPNHPEASPFIWVNFSGTHEGATLIEVDPAHHPVLMRCLYHYKIHEYLAPLVRFCKIDMNHGNEYWIEEGQVPGDADLRCFLKFRLQITIDFDQEKPRLRVIFTGRTWLVRKSVERLVCERRLDPYCLTGVVFNREVCRYDKLPEEVRYRLRKVYPVYNPGLGEAMGISPNDVPEESSPAIAFTHLDAFFNTYLNTQVFKQIIPHTGHWLPVPASRQFILPNRDRTLCFGQHHHHTDTLHGLQTHGPASLPPCRQVRVFVIYHQSDTIRAERFIKTGCCPKGQKQITSLTRLPVIWDLSLNLVLNDLRPPVILPMEEIRAIAFDPMETYVALYLAPGTPDKGHPDEISFRYRLAGQLLTRGVAMHTIDTISYDDNHAGKVFIDLAIALISKSGGIPWHLPYSTARELIVGMASAPTSPTAPAGTTGQAQTAAPAGTSVFTFDTTGICRSFDVWPDPPDWLLRATLLEAITSYRQQHPHLDRVVIHYHGKIKGHIYDQLDDFLGAVEHVLPVVMAGISHPGMKEPVIMSPTHAQHLPPNGTYVEIKPHTYLLFINGNDDDHTTATTPPFQLKLKLHSNRIGYLDNKKVVEEVLQQVYGFCLMNFHLGNQARLPVSVVLPELLARLFPLLDRLALDEEIGRKRLWFV
ncbi:MAG TPA: hypothetical protein DCR43_01320 [Bacteroidales bacterium]|nr:hypothetical protein [Bacteroidales bacterium]